jgi:DNA gyrase/topoisomerase IV subunit A
MIKLFKNMLGISEIQKRMNELESRIALLEIILNKQTEDLTRIGELLSIVVMTNPQLRAKKIFDEEVSDSSIQHSNEKLNKDGLN